MDWNLAINRNRDALISVIAGLYAFAGLANGAVFSVLPRHAYRTILRLLRPAESAVRRLIILAAHDMLVKLKNRLLQSSNTSKNDAPRWAEFSKLAPKSLTFQLIEPLKRFSLVPFERHTGPLPRISVPGLYDPVFSVQVDPSPQDPMNAAHISLRLAALSRALGALSAQARRLARWQARRDLALQSKTTFNPLRKPIRMSPFRPGSPPGARQRRRDEVDHILRECHLLMLDRLADTS